MLDVLIVSLGSTGGLRAVDGELLASLRRAGARADIARARAPRRMRTLMLTDLAWALAARRAASEALAREQARAVIYSTTTAALSWPRPGAIRFDALAAANRPGRHGLWQRPLERRRLREATLLLPQSEGALAEAPGAMPDTTDRGGGNGVKGGVKGARGDVKGGVLVLPVPVEPSSSQDELAHGPRDIAAITYAANPAKKGLDVLLAAWARVHGPGEQLYVAGVAESELRALGYALPAEGVRVAGALSPEDYRALLRRARAYVCAARREDYGIAQLEALADGCVLVTVPSPGPYAALPLARELDGRLVSEDIGTAMRLALDDPAAGYADRAARALTPFRREAVDRRVASELLPRFLA
ncbi:MAG TPA: glycosyltransferase [Solirubrobacteraceae bacterium]|jgi:glycosyltransferase involved in cell wall biosynthesis|nr:glycosyltransferase [Solirubrobacteraceae bacterium]